MMGAPFQWQEPEKSPTNMNFGADFGTRVMSFDIDWLSLQDAIKYIVGFSTTWPVFDPNTLATQGPYSLKRQNPARCPPFPALRATQILSIQGIGARDTGVGAQSGKVTSGAVGSYTNWSKARVTVKFEIPTYPILTDEELAGRPEYLRNHLFDFESNVETISRKGVSWVASSTKAARNSYPPWNIISTYGIRDRVSYLGRNWSSKVAANIGHIPAVGAYWRRDVSQFAGDRMLRQPKGTLTIRGFDIHRDFIMLGKLVDSAYYRRVGTVNARPFPRYGFRDQTVAGDFPVRFRPGTCLLLPPKTTARTCFHPSVIAAFTDPLFLTRTVDVETKMIIFDPPTDDDTHVDLSAASYGYATDDMAATKVRGHQLAPLPYPSATGFLFYAFYMTQSATDPDAFTGPAQLLYPYSDFEALYQGATSLPTD